MHIVSADSYAQPLTESELRELLARPEILQLGLVGEEGWPLVHPLWFLFDEDKIWLTVGGESLKARLLERSDKAYFSIDVGSGDMHEIRGVRGKARARLVREQQFVVEMTRKHLQKYLGRTDGEQAETMLADAQSGSTVCVELTPLKYATWKY